MNGANFLKRILTLSFTFIFLLSTCLLLYSAWVSDFDSDELSSILRASNAENFTQHINMGVLPDGHPSGIQTIIWIGTHFGGCTPFIFRLMWIIMTILGNIYFKKWLYKIAKSNGSEEHTANWISMLGYAFISLMWWPLSLGSWLRPYAPGYAILMFFLYQFEQIKQKPDSWMNTALFLGLLGYIHYFALLTALTYFLASWGWDFRFKSTKVFIKIGAVAIIINLPQLFVIQHQFQLEGLNWLGKPKLDFIFEHLHYISGNNHIIQWLFVVVIVLRIGFHPPKKDSVFNKNIMVWIFIFIVLFVYSLFRKPVLQNNAMYFAFPFLISFFVEMLVDLLHTLNHKSLNFTVKNPLNSKGEIVNSFVLVGSIILLLNNTFIEKMYFFPVRIHDRYAEPFRILDDFKLYQRKNISVLIDGPNDVLSYNKKHFLTDSLEYSNLIFIQSISDSTKNIPNQKWLDWTNGEWGCDTLILALNSGSNLNILNILQHRSRRISLPWRRNYWVHRTVGGEMQCFVRKSVKNQRAATENPHNPHLFEYQTDNNSRKPNNLRNIQSSDYKIVTQADIFSKNPFFINLNTLKIQPYDLIAIRLISSHINLDSIKLISALFKQGFNKSQMQYDYRWEQGSSDTCIYLTLKLADIPQWNPESTLRLSLEYPSTFSFKEKSDIQTKNDIRTSNSKKSELEVISIDSTLSKKCLYEIEIIPGNPFTYGI